MQMSSDGDTQWLDQWTMVRVVGFWGPMSERLASGASCRSANS